jgi:hypothetical protein
VGSGLQDYQVVYPAHAFLVRLLLRLNHLVSKRRLFFMQFMEVFNRPILEPRGNLNAREEMIDLLFKLLAANALLSTGWQLAFGTVVILKAAVEGYPLGHGTV